MSPINSPHASMVNRLTRILNKLLERKATISPQNPIDLGAKYSELEPDITVAKYRADDYEEFHPHLEDIFLLIEVADSSLLYDQTEKLAMYADKKIEEYWIVNLGRKKVEIYRQPKGERYEFKQVIDRNGVLTCETIDFQLNAKEIFGLNLKESYFVPFLVKFRPNKYISGRWYLFPFEPFLLFP